MLRTFYFLSLMLTAIAMSLALAHLFELPNKIDISATHYLIVQRNYDNWATIGLIVPAAFLSVVALTIALRGTGAPFALALIALLLLVGELVAFWGFIFPVNQATQNWTILPDALRSQWEYAHAVRAILYVLTRHARDISAGLAISGHQGQESLMRIYLDWNLPPPSLVGLRWNPRSVGRER